MVYASSLKTSVTQLVIPFNSIQELVVSMITMMLLVLLLVLASNTPARQTTYQSIHSPVDPQGEVDIHQYQNHELKGPDFVRCNA